MTPLLRCAVLGVSLAMAACARDPQAEARAFVGSADRYLAKGEVGKAIIEYRNAIDRHESVASTHYKLGLAYERASDQDRALAAFVRAAHLDPEHVDAHLRASAGLVDRQQHAEAKRLAEAVLAVEPRNAMALALAAAAEVGLGNTAKGERRLAEALALQPRFALAHRLFGAALLRRGERKSARVALQTAVDEDPASASAWAQLGQACWALGDLKAAEAALRRGLQADPTSADIHRHLTAFFIGTGRTALAEPHLRALAETSTQQRLVLADYYMAVSRNEDAMRELDRIADKDLAHVVRLRKAVLTHRSGDKTRAYRELDAMAADRDTAPEATLVKSELLVQDDEVDAALREAERSAGLRSGWADASYMVAVIQLIRGDAEAGIRWLQRARTEGADGPAIDLGLARAALMQGELDRAIALSRVVLHAAPSLQAALILSRALRGKRDVNEARTAIASARERWGDAPALDVEEGQLELSAGRPTPARLAFGRALAHGSPSAGARSGLLAAMVAGGGMSSAHQQMDAWLASDPGNIQNLLLSARLDAVEGRLDAAERTLMGAQQQAPRDAEVARELSRVSLARGQFREAAGYMARAADAAPRPVAELVALGMLREQAADVAGAKTAYERALVLDPHVGIAANNLAWIYAGEGRVSEAVALAERAEQALGGVPQSLHTLGSMYRLHGDLDRAIPWLRRAGAAAPDNPRYRRDLEEAYRQAGRPMPDRP